MKKNAINKIREDLTKSNIGSGMIMINYEGRTIPFNPHEGNDEYFVDEDNNILELRLESGTHWIDCDAVTSIEI